MFCNKCGATLKDGAKFCNKCGELTKYGKAAQSEQPQIITPKAQPQPAAAQTASNTIQLPAFFFNIKITGLIASALYFIGMIPGLSFGDWFEILIYRYGLLNLILGYSDIILLVCTILFSLKNKPKVIFIIGLIATVYHIVFCIIGEDYIWWSYLESYILCIISGICMISGGWLAMKKSNNGGTKQ